MVREEEKEPEEEGLAGNPNAEVEEATSPSAESSTASRKNPARGGGGGGNRRGRRRHLPARGHPQREQLPVEAAVKNSLPAADEEKEDSSSQPLVPVLLSACSGHRSPRYTSRSAAACPALPAGERDGVYVFNGMVY